jgi:hypothetical protein
MKIEFKLILNGSAVTFKRASLQLQVSLDQQGRLTREAFRDETTY